MGEIRVKSRNLATDVHTWERAELSPSGVVVPTPTSGDYGIVSDYIPITGGGTYTYSHNNGFPVSKSGTNPFRVIGWWDINKNWIKRDGNANDSADLTITAPNNAAYARLCYKSYGNLEGCSFAAGSTALPYQPYFLTLPAHEKTSTGWKDIPTHIMTATGWQGELTSQSPLEFRATGQSLLDWRIDGASGGVGDWDETEQQYKIPITVNDTTTNLYTTSQLMDGDSLDYTTDQTSIPITQGDNTLTVDTQVQPSKVFVKFEG